VDNAGNIETTFTSGVNQRVFIYDVSLPTSTPTRVTVNSNVVYLQSGDNYINNLTQIEGTDSDWPSSPYGAISTVRVYIEKLDSPGAGSFWDGTNNIWRSDLGAIANDTSLSAYGWYYDTSGINFATGGGAWSGGGKFRIRSEAVDQSYPGNAPPPNGNREKGGVYTNLNYYDVVYDNELPRSNITNVNDGDYKNNYPQIQGTASDINSAVGYTPFIDSVKVNIYDTINNKTYNGNTDPTSWDSGSLTDSTHWFNTSFVGVSSGVWTFSSPAWQHTIQYRLVSKAYDKAGNTQVSLSTVNFIYDIYQSDPEMPDSSISVPVNNQNFNYKFTQMTGSSLDNVRGVVAGVKLKIIRYPNPYLSESTTYYWNNITQNWDSADPNSNQPKWPDTSADDGSFNTNAENWHWNTPQSGAAAVNFWQAGRKYDAVSTSYDKAGNYEIKWTTNTFVYETDIPTATITYPLTNGYVTQNGKVTGVSADNYPGQVANVYVRIKRDDNQYYNSNGMGGWQGTSTFNDVVTYGYLSSNGTYWYLYSTPWET
jgi:hypothetical protein